MQLNKIQEIAANSAANATQDFLGSLPPEVSQALPPGYLATLEEELQAELRSAIASRLQWFEQAIRLEQQQPQAVPSPLISNADPGHIFESAIPQKSSASSALLAELKSGVEPPPPIASAAEQPSRKRFLSRNPDAQDQAADPATQLPGPDSGSAPFPTSQPELPKPNETQTSRPSLRRRGKEPQATREEILKAYNIGPELLNRPQDPEVKPRRRRRRSPALA